MTTFGRFSNQRQFASFLGLVPMMSSSGDKEYVGEKTFRERNSSVQKIVEASWIAYARRGTLRKVRRIVHPGNEVAGSHNPDSPQALQHKYFPY
ncbi:transposase [Duncaniella dubosii]|uniref:transposase n=1 Tax=Duncaniella dubosii TaxID=2518971 RepID=UPI003F66C1D0